ncbi:hypothetical protein JCM10020v2_002673 [Rhodotorula toruloides]
MSPNFSDSQPTFTPRACLDSLPTEVKSRIAELCWLQDEWWREYDKHIRTQFASAGAPEVARFRQLHEVEGKRYGRSLMLLARTSRAWAELTAPLRFRVVKVSKANRPVFRQLIVRRHAQHCHELHFDEVDVEKFVVFLAFLPAFIAVKKLVIDNKLSAEFCGKVLEPWCHYLDDAAVLSRSDIAHLIKRVESLTYSVPWHRLPPTLKAAETLTSFSFRIEDATNAVTTLTTILSAAPGLHSLSVDATDCQVDFSGLPSSSRSTWPTLTSLALKAERIDPSFSAFLSHHQASLRHLRLEWTEGPSESDDGTFAFLPPATFPALDTLDIIECGISPLVPLLTSIKPASLPNLRNLTVVPAFGEDDEFGFGDSGMDVCLDSIALQYQPRLLFVRYYESERCLWPHCAFVASNIPSDHNIRLDMTPVSPYPRPVFYVPDDSAELEDLDLFERSISNTMDFLVSWHARVKQSKDTYQYGHLASALKLIELERVAQTA